MLFTQNFVQVHGYASPKGTKEGSFFFFIYASYTNLKTLQLYNDTTWCSQFGIIQVALTFRGLCTCHPVIRVKFLVFDIFVSINFLQNYFFIENSNSNLNLKDSKIFPLRFCNEKIRQTGANLLHLPVINKNPPDFYLHFTDTLKSTVIAYFIT